MGTYPVSIKTPSVVEVGAHPIVFQLWKSFWALIVGIFFFAAVYSRGHTFQWSWWAIASAAAWIPAGLCTISAVPIVGVSMCQVVQAATASTTSFLVFWLIFGEEVKQHNGVPLAPFYLVLTLMGMAGLVLGPRIKKIPCEKPDRDLLVNGNLSHSLVVDGEAPVPEAAPPMPRALAAARAQGGPAWAGETPPRLLRRQKTVMDLSRKDFSLGILFAMGSGFFASLQVGLVTLGRKVVEEQDSCSIKKKTCSAAVQEEFDVLGSWIVCFGFGAAIVTIVFFGLLTAYRATLAKPRPTPVAPELHLRVLAGPGSIAGIFWNVGNILITLAVSDPHGGQAIVMTQVTSVNLVVSGIWGLIFYREVLGWRAGIWVFFALWTICFMILLSFEKVEPPSDPSPSPPVPPPASPPITNITNITDFTMW